MGTSLVAVLRTPFPRRLPLSAGDDERAPATLEHYALKLATPLPGTTPAAQRLRSTRAATGQDALFEATDDYVRVTLTRR